jgi:hypothetical protein
MAKPSEKTAKRIADAEFGAVGAETKIFLATER